MSKRILLRKLVCVLLCSGLASKVLIAQKNYGNPVAEAEVRSYFGAHAAQFSARAADISSLKVTTDFVEASAGIRHIYVQQQFGGLDVVNGTAALHLKEGGVPVHSTYQFAKVDSASTGFSAFTPATAVQKAMAEVNIIMPVGGLQIKQASSGTEEKTVFRAANTTWDIPVRKAYLVSETSNQLVGVWEVQLYRKDLHNYWIIYLNGTTGKLVSKTDMVVKCDFGRPQYETDEFIPNDNNCGPVNRLPAITLTTKKAQQFENIFHAGIATNTQIRLEDQPGNSVAAGIVNQYRVLDKPFEGPNQAGALDAMGKLQLVSTGGDALASPDGWHKVQDSAITYQYTRGNNVWAFQDPSPGPLGGVPSADPTRTAYNNTITVTLPTGGTTTAPSPTEPFKFDYNPNFTMDPTTYQNAAIVNLFYWNNLMHDVFYQFGFTEANRNFENSHNFSNATNRGNIPAGQNDEVLAQAQDGGGTNNANFLTLKDGTNGQMQMYLWTGSLPDSIVRIGTSVTHPPANGQNYYAIQGSFGNSNTNNTPIDSTDLFRFPVLNKPYVLVQKSALSTVGTSSQGCGTGQMSVALPPSNNVRDKIVLIDRGTCSFVEKMLCAQEGGAAGVIVINNVPGAAPINMGGTDAPTNAIRIPGVMVTYEAGQELKAALAASGDGSIIGSLQKTQAAPRRDGDLDNGVVSHEYGHGISTRLTNGGPNPTGFLSGAEQGGEGWSDNFALYMTTKTTDLLPATSAHPNGVLPDRGIGSYVVYQPHVGGLGIREYKYSIDMTTNPATFGYVKLPAYSEAHSVGFVWCTMLYDMQQVLIDKYGFNDDVYNPANPVNNAVPAGAGGNNVAMRLVMQGLMLQPGNPTFIQERDAILKADSVLYGAADACILWQAFAKRGLGFSAVSGTNALGDETEQFNTNPICVPQTLLSITKTADALVNNNGTINYTIVAKNISSIALATTGLVIRDTLPQYTNIINADGGTVGNNGTVISWPVASLAQNASVTHNISVQVTHPTPAQLILSEDQENTAATNKFQSAATDGSVRTFALITDATRKTGTGKVWFVQDYDIPGSNATLRLKSPITVPTGTQLIFNHKYASEASYDGGVVEVSTDNTNWTPLTSAAFSKNGYNGAISMTNNPFIGTATLNAFTGSSPGYVQSIATLGTYTSPIYIRFRFTSDATGGSVDGGGWWIDEVYLASPATFVTNTAVAAATNAPSAVSATASTLIVSTTILPIAGVQELRASVRSKTIVLNWETTSERDNRGFEILRKAPDEKEFKSIGFVKGAGNSSSIIPYTYTDATAAKGVLYQYRLKQVSTSNDIQYSNTVSARIVDQAFAFSFSPNPAHSLVTFNINNESRSAVSIEIADMTGKKVKTINAGNESYISTRLGIDNFAKGVYLVTIRSGNNTETQKLVVE